MYDMYICVRMKNHRPRNGLMRYCRVLSKHCFTAYSCSCLSQVSQTHKRRQSCSLLCGKVPNGDDRSDEKREDEENQHAVVLHLLCPGLPRRASGTILDRTTTYTPGVRSNRQQATGNPVDLSGETPQAFFALGLGVMCCNLLRASVGYVM